MGKNFLTLFILFFTLFLVEANSIQLNIDESTSQLEFHAEHVSCFIDSTGEMDVRTVQNKKFTSLSGPFINDKIGHAYWLRFDLKSHTKETKKWVLEIMDSHQEIVEVYMFRNDTLAYKSKTGQLVDDTTRLYEHKNHIVDLPIKAEDDLRFYIRFKSEIVGSLLFKIRTNASFSSYALKEYYFLGLYYGFLFLICLINLVMFVLVKEKIYLLSLVYVLAWVLLSMIDDGIGRHLIWSDFTWVDRIGIFRDKTAFDFFLCLVFFNIF